MLEEVAGGSAKNAIDVATVRLKCGDRHAPFDDLAEYRFHVREGERVAEVTGKSGEGLMDVTKSTAAGPPIRDRHSPGEEVGEHGDRNITVDGQFDIGRIGVGRGGWLRRHVRRWNLIRNRSAPDPLY
jgi:hypothetical protein